MNMEIMASVKIRVKPGKATPAPPVGPAIGQYGVNLKDVCDHINRETTIVMQSSFWIKDDDALVPVRIYIARDKRFIVKARNVTIMELIKKLCKIKKGASDAKEIIKEIQLSELEDIAARKLKDSNAYDVARFVRSVAGTAKSMGIKVIDDSADSSGGVR